MIYFLQGATVIAFIVLAIEIRRTHNPWLFYGFGSVTLFWAFVTTYQASQGTHWWGDPIQLAAVSLAAFATAVKQAGRHERHLKELFTEVALSAQYYQD